MVYNFTNVTNANNILTIAEATNELSGGLFIALFMIVIYIGFIMVFYRQNFKAVLLAASFLMVILGSMIFVLGLGGMQFIIIPIILFAASLLIFLFVS